MILQQMKRGTLTILHFYRYFVVLFVVIGCWLYFAAAANETDIMI